MKTVFNCGTVQRIWQVPVDEGSQSMTCARLFKKIHKMRWMGVGCWWMLGLMLLPGTRNTNQILASVSIAKSSTFMTLLLCMAQPGFYPTLLNGDTNVRVHGN